MSIGLILCKGRNKVTVECALRDNTCIIGVVAYTRFSRKSKTPSRRRRSYRQNWRVKARTCDHKR
ncbi:DUF1016 family protein [Candidatus Bipolaricaulota bacterium]|nr:DUF1016 family protein [Candidatus Bipolaricaulota bacterium]